MPLGPWGVVIPHDVAQMKLDELLEYAVASKDNLLVYGAEAYRRNVNRKARRENKSGS